MLTFASISKFTEAAHYQVHIPWTSLIDNIKHYENSELSKLNLNPDFQRGHVWTEKQKRLYVEYKLQRGPDANIIYFNCKGWMNNFEGPFVIVDGLQRLTAIIQFLNNKLSVFGHKCFEYSDQRFLRSIYLIFVINELKTKAEVLKWYLEINCQGTPHTDAELQKVRNLLSKEEGK